MKLYCNGYSDLILLTTSVPGILLPLFSHSVVTSYQCIDHDKTKQVYEAI